MRNWIALARKAHVDQHLRALVPSQSLLRERLAAPTKRQHHLQRRDDRIARGGVLRTDYMPGVLTTQCPATLKHLRDHVAISHLGAGERYLPRFQGKLKPQVTHQRADNAASQPISLLQISRHDVKQFVALPDHPGMVDHPHRTEKRRTG